MEQEMMEQEPMAPTNDMDWEQSDTEHDMINWPEPSVQDLQVQPYSQYPPNQPQIVSAATPAFVADLRRTRPTISAQARQDLQQWLEVPTREPPRKDSVYSVAPERLLRARRGKTE